MEVVDEVAHTIDGVEPRAVRVLVFEDEVQVPLCNARVVIILEKSRRTGEQECAISGGVDDTARVER